MTPAQTARMLLRLHGWTAHVQDDLPERCVVVAEPHTSNWDGYYMVLGSLALGLEAHWMIKAEHDRGVIGDLLRKTRAVFVERGKGGAVRSVVEAFKGKERMRLSIAASGTRKHTDHWRTGFLQIAREADVPLALGYVDYARKQVGIGPAVDCHLPDDELMAIMTEFYADKTAAIPANKSPVVWTSQAANRKG
ncbi:MAG: 1-acyl-sn-glycerol-3-phosphate acyltransferase [Deltaproteobacteria bacterium]|nr:1-acyl-sn-glycerol-3-phosphate acyltransferase [Deltaproteobacteria bacterium]